jgi:hypothetical protein
MVPHQRFFLRGNQKMLEKCHGHLPWKKENEKPMAVANPDE